MANIPALKQAFLDGLDIHAMTASEMFGVPLDEMTADVRRQAKAINFGVIYGISGFGLARNLRIPRSEAQGFIDRYFERYPGVKAYMDDTRAKAHETGYVETLFGRRLYLPEINSSNIPRQRAAERAAINAPMQGTAADIIKCAMINVTEFINKQNSDIRMIMQVHDELVFEIKEDKIALFTEPLRQAMDAAADLKVPLTVGIGYGDNWGEAH